MLTRADVWQVFLSATACRDDVNASVGALSRSAVDAKARTTSTAPSADATPHFTCYTSTKVQILTSEEQAAEDLTLALC
jgi:hypothetical protein